jgi:hypothetical protein
MGAAVLLVVANAGIFPVPEAPSPMAVLLLVQVKDVAPVPLNVTALEFVPLHFTWSEGSETVGVGFTVMVKLCGVPSQVTPPPVKCGVTVIVELIAALVEFEVVKAAISPVPLAAKVPMAVLELVQEYEVAPLPENVTALVLVPAHFTWSAGSLTTGVGFTVMVKV